jgi:hypothetical protein
VIFIVFGGPCSGGFFMEFLGVSELSGSWFKRDLLEHGNVSRIQVKKMLRLKTPVATLTGGVETTAANFVPSMASSKLLSQHFPLLH